MFFDTIAPLRGKRVVFGVGSGRGLACRWGQAGKEGEWACCREDSPRCLYEVAMYDARCYIYRIIVFLAVPGLLTS
jgi:hypothetical protein